MRGGRALLKRRFGCLIAILASLLALTPASSAQEVANLPGVEIGVGANFYPIETWGPNRLRRWANQNAEVSILNASHRPQTVDLRFYAFAFHIRRDLQVTFDGRLVARWVVYPTAERYIVIKALPLESGLHRLVLSTPQAALTPAQVGENTELRPLTVAVSPLSIIAANTPEARLEWTAPFPAWAAESKFFPPFENAANNLRREGRFPEAAHAYELALTRGATEYAYPAYAAILVALERRADGLRVLQQCLALSGSGVRRDWVRGICQRLNSYIAGSPLLSQTNRDPGRRARTEGKIYEAVETYERILATEPDAIQAHYWLGMLNGLAGRRTEARLHLEHVIALAGDTPDGKFLQAILTYF